MPTYGRHESNGANATDCSLVGLGGYSAYELFMARIQFIHLLFTFTTQKEIILNVCICVFACAYELKQTNTRQLGEVND